MSSEIVTRGVLLTGQKSDKVSHRAISSALTARFFYSCLNVAHFIKDRRHN